MNVTIEAITLIQPWAGLIVAGPKRVENRTWYTPHRGLLLLHAGKKTMSIDPVYWEETGIDSSIAPSLPAFRLGALVGIAILTRIQKATVDCPTLWHDPPCMSKNFWWELADVVAFDPPLPYRGDRGLWEAVIPAESKLQHGTIADYMNEHKIGMNHVR